MVALSRLKIAVFIGKPPYRAERSLEIFFNAPITAFVSMDPETVFVFQVKT